MDRVTIWLERLGFLLRVLGIAGCMAGILLLTFDRQKPIPEEPDHQWIESVDADVYEGERSSEWQAVLVLGLVVWCVGFNSRRHQAGDSSKELCSKRRSP